MRYLTTLAVFAAIVGLTTTQTINPDDVPISDRRQWCDAQQTQCPLICMQVEDNSGSPESNTCDPDTLVYSCVCGNGAAPNSSEFSQTIPYFICTWSNNECVDACGNNNICADNCRANNPCGAQSPTLINTSTITATAAATGTQTGAAATGTDGADSAQSTDPADYAGFGDDGDDDDDEGNGSGDNEDAAVAMVHLGRSYGLGLVVAGVAVGFAVLL